MSKLLKSIVLATGLMVPAGVQADGTSGAYLAARLAGSENDFEAAARYFSRALIEDPSNALLLENALAALIGLGEIERAVPIARAVDEFGYDSQLAAMVSLTSLSANADWDKILDRMEAGMSIGPLMDGLAQAWAHVGQGDMTRALGDFDELADAPGLRAFGLYHKALALALVGDFEGADAIFSSDDLPPTRRGVIAHAQVLSQLERGADAVTLLGDTFGEGLDPELSTLRDTLETGEPVEFNVVTSAADGMAEAYFSVAGAVNGDTEDTFTLLYARMAEHLRPDFTAAILLSAELLERLGRYELASAAYDTVPREDPSFHLAELGRAGSLQLSGRDAEALEVLRQLAESHADLPLVQVRLADLLRQTENHEAAVDRYTTAIALFDTPDEGHWYVYYNRAVSLSHLDNWPAAEADFRRALEMRPDQPQVLNYLGYSLVERREKLTEALDLINRAVEAEPDSGYIVDSLGWAQFRLGLYDDAVTNLERAAALVPVDPVVNDHLGDAFWAVGRITEARFQWQRALSFDPEEAEAARIKRKLEIGLDRILLEEGAAPLELSRGG